MARADALGRAKHQAGAASAKPAAKPASFRKRCPRCRRDLPARRLVCDCGHRFNVSTSQPGGQKSNF
jgi:hypothetical protein